MCFPGTTTMPTIRRSRRTASSSGCPRYSNVMAITRLHAWRPQRKCPRRGRTNVVDAAQLALEDAPVGDCDAEGAAHAGCYEGLAGSCCVFCLFGCGGHLAWYDGAGWPLDIDGAPIFGKRPRFRRKRLFFKMAYLNSCHEHVRCVILDVHVKNTVPGQRRKPQSVKSDGGHFQHQPPNFNSTVSRTRPSRINWARRPQAPLK
jgi:hypothetical protein